MAMNTKVSAAQEVKNALDHRGCHEAQAEDPERARGMRGG